MPATGLKIVVTGAFLQWGSISSTLHLFWVSRLWVSGVFGFGICSHSCQIYVSSCWRVCGLLWHIFHLMMCQMFSIGERTGLQAGQFIRTLLLRSHAVVIAAVCGFALSFWNTWGLPWNRRLLEGSICCSKTFIYLSAFIVPSKTCKLPIPYALMHPIPSEMLAFELKSDDMMEGLPPL